MLIPADRLLESACREFSRLTPLWAFVRDASGANVLPTGLTSSRAGDLNPGILPFLKGALALSEQSID